jgi:hypothetical protein
MEQKIVATAASRVVAQQVVDKLLKVNTGIYSPYSLALLQMKTSIVPKE